MDARALVAPVADDIRRFADEVEAGRQLPSELMGRLTEAGLFSIYTPKQFGGMELPFPDALRVVEEVARHDGSTGWTVALGFANALFTSVLPEPSAARVLEGGHALIAGSPAFAARAVVTDGGYRLSGQWQFASGAPNATWLTALAPIFDGDNPRIGPFGPETVMLFCPPEDIEIVDTWHVTGLRGSGSHDVRANDVFVPVELTGPVSMAGAQPVRDCTLARLPLLTAIGVAQAPPTCLGIAAHAIEAFTAVVRAKERPFGPKLPEQAPIQAGLARAEAKVRAGRAYFYETVEAAWEKALASEPFSPLDRASVRMACLTAAENAVDAVDILHRLAGTSSVFQACELERCWRDIHTAGQHQAVQDGRWESVGQALFGMEVQDPFL